MPSLVVIGPQIKKKRGGGGAQYIYGYIIPSLYGSKRPHLNKVKVRWYYDWPSFSREYESAESNV